MKVVKNQPSRVQLPEGFYDHDFAKIAKSERDPCKRSRLTGLGILQQKKSIKGTAKLLKIARQTLRDWLKKFKDKGLDGLSDKLRSGRPPRLPREKHNEFAQAIVQLQTDRKGGRITGRDIQQLAKDKFGAELSLDRIYTLMKQLRIVWITGRSQHPKANESSQEDFKKKFEDNICEILPADVSIDQVEVFFEDESRVGQQGTLTRIWTKKGTRTRLKKLGINSLAFLELSSSYVPGPGQLLKFRVVCYFYGMVLDPETSSG